MAVESDQFAQLASLPARPGCYLFRDASDAVLYVGKSVSLRTRVRSYFHGPMEGRTRDLVARVTRIETIVTETETAARVLEAELIRRLQPPFNVRQEHFPFLCVTVTEPLPRVRVAAHPRGDGNRYFGPYPDAASIDATLRILTDVFQLRLDERPTTDDRRPTTARRPAPNPRQQHIADRDLPQIARLEYRASVNGALRFLEGHREETQRVLREQMEAAAAAMAFEEAARLRDLWRAVCGGDGSG